MKAAFLPVVVVTFALAGCGDKSAEPPASSPAPTLQGDASAAPQTSGANAYIGSIAVDPADGTLLLGTGLGLFEVEAGAERATRVVGRLATADGSGSLSSNLVVRFRGPGELLASGHPEGASALPEDLGLIRSRDGGRTWEPISELGRSDHHVIQVVGDRIAVIEQDAAELRISRDGGRSYEPRSAPGTPLDVALDPDDPARIVLSTEDQGVFTSSDEGQSWRPRDSVPGAQLVWSAADRLYRSDPGGLIKMSADGGETWEHRGSVGLPVNELAVDRDGTLYASVAGGEVRSSSDGGNSWTRHVVLD